MIVAPVFFIETCAWRHEKIHAEHWLYSIFFAFFVKLYRAVHVAVVGKRDGFLAVVFGGFHEFGDLGQGLEEGIVRMNVQMNEIFQTGHTAQYNKGVQLWSMSEFGALNRFINRLLDGRAPDTDSQKAPRILFDKLVD